MNVIIEARSLIGSRGTQVYTRELITHLSRLGESLSIEVIHASHETAPLFPHLKNTVIPLTSEAFLLPWLNGAVANHIRRANPDLVHFTKADVPFRRLGVPIVTTIYDVIPLQLPQTQSLLRRLYWKSALSRAAKKSSAVVTISEASKRYISQFLGTSLEKIHAIPLGVDMNHFKPESKSSSVPYILFVGRWDERKNVPALIHAFERIADTIPHTLVIAGRPADKESDVKSLAKKSPVANRISFQEDVPYAKLPHLYANADVFVFPSIIEGWGLPPLEALACGTPTIVSDGAPMPEVVGDVGIVVPFSTDDLSERLHDTGFVENLSNALKDLILNQEQQKQLSMKGPMQARKFSWEETARQTFDVYKKVLS